jgi:hypothetical protein
MKAHTVKAANGAILSMQEMGEVVSSTVAEHASSIVSKNYAFISTKQIIEALAVTDFPLAPVYAKEQGTRKEEKIGYAKHVVRLRPVNNTLLVVGNCFPEVVITNSHCRTASFTIEAGIFRPICSNGLVVCAQSVGKYTQRHTGCTIENVLDAVYKIVEDFPQIDTLSRTMQNTILEPAKQLDFAERALALRYPEVTSRPITASALLSVRRYADQGADLWSVFNRIQENSVKGGLGYRRLVSGNAEAKTWRKRHQHIERGTTREVTGLDASLELNRQLWTLAMEYTKVYA